MSLQVAVGDELVGKVMAIKDYGAFVQLSPGRSGLVHISQIAREYVNRVEDYLAVGDEVKVKVISIQGNRISLSIKQVAPIARKDGQKAINATDRANANESKPPPYHQAAKKDKALSLEEKLKKWMKASEERLQQLQSKKKRR